MAEYGKDLGEFPAPFVFPVLGALAVEFAGDFAGSAAAAVSEPAVEHVAPAGGVVAHAWGDAGEEAALDDQVLVLRVVCDRGRQRVRRDFSGVLDLGVRALPPVRCAFRTAATWVDAACTEGGGPQDVVAQADGLMPEDASGGQRDAYAERVEVIRVALGE